MPPITPKADPIIRRPTTCRVCGGKDLVTYLDFGGMPFANAYYKTQYKATEWLEYNALSVAFCQFCGLSQLNQVADPRILFKDYAFKSGISKHFRQHCKELVDTNAAYISQDGLWIDIGGNDGTLLECVADATSLTVLNIDPAASGKIQHIKEEFNHNTAKRLVESGVRANVITAQNVVAHVDDLDDFLGGVALLLNENGLFIMEVPYMGYTLSNCEFDQIYHEHLSYFLLGPLNRILRRHGLGIVRVDSLPVHGGSMRVTCQLDRDDTDEASRWISHEEAAGYYNLETYYKFALEANNRRRRLQETLADFGPVAAIGACAKGTTLLNWCGFNTTTRKHVKYIADETPEKQGKYQAGTGIPIVSPTHLRGETTVLILSWNWTNEIMERYPGPENWILPHPPYIITPHGGEWVKERLWKTRKDKVSPSMMLK